MNDPNEATNPALAGETPPPIVNGETTGLSASAAAAEGAGAAPAEGAAPPPLPVLIPANTESGEPIQLKAPAAEVKETVPAGGKDAGAAAKSADAPAGAMAAAGEAPVRVADITKDGRDYRGEKIECVFFKRRNYAIYRTAERVLVQYADDDAEADKQAAKLAPLISPRDRLQYLLGGVMEPHRYHWQIAEALRLALEGQIDEAKNTLNGAIEDIKTTRVRLGRRVYLRWAGTLAFATAAVLLAAGAAVILLYGGGSFANAASGIGHLLLATAAGALGAMLSTAIALQQRTVATDGDVVSNAMDSAVRIMIGVISAGILYLILGSGVLTTIAVGEMKLNANGITWQIALLIGFFAGFLERLVPDLLEKKAPTSAAPAAAKPAGSQ